MDEKTGRSVYGSRLVRLLCDLNLADTGIAEYHFGEKFAEMLHFSGAVILSGVLNSPAAAGFTRSDRSVPAAKNAFLSGHNDLVRSIAASFRKDRLPTAEVLHRHCCATGAFPKRGKKSMPHAALFEPYRQFYITGQRMLEAGVQQLRADIRDRIAGISPELARLARFDKVLADSLAAAPREILARVPLFLGRHFRRRFEKPWQALADHPEPADLEPWTAPGGWITNFCDDMRELLFAELEIRLQPVAGMIESLPEPAGPDHPGGAPLTEQ